MYLELRVWSSINSSICSFDKLKKAFSELEIIAEHITSNATIVRLITIVPTSAVVRVVLIMLNTLLTGGSEIKLLCKVYKLS